LVVTEEIIDFSESISIQFFNLQLKKAFKRLTRLKDNAITAHRIDAFSFLYELCELGIDF